MTNAELIAEIDREVYEMTALVEKETLPNWCDVAREVERSKVLNTKSYKDLAKEFERVCKRRKAMDAENEEICSLWQEVTAEVLSKPIYTLVDATREFERVFVMRALVRMNGNASITADFLGTHRNCIARRVSPHIQRKLRRIIKKRKGKA